MTAIFNTMTMLFYNKSILFINSNIFHATILFFFSQGVYILALLKCGFQITAIGEDERAM